MSADARASGRLARHTATHLRPTLLRTYHVSHAGRFVPTIGALTDDPRYGPRHVFDV